MSRAQETKTFNTAAGQNAGYFNNAQNSYAQAQNDIGDYKDQLAKYISSKPYVAGGQFQKNTNQVIANTNDASARAAGDALQSQALRTGQNSAGAVAATERMQEQTARDTSAEQARANQERISAGANYDKSALAATEVPAQFEGTLAGQQSSAGEGALGTEQKAGETKSFWDQFGDSVATGLGGAVDEYATGKGAKGY